MMVFLEFAALGAVAVTTMSVLWARQLRTHDATEVDTAWAVLVGLGATWLSLCGDGSSARRILISGLALTWSCRLVGLLMRRHAAGSHREDGRYRYLRTTFGAQADRRFLVFYLIQALASVAFSATFLAAAHDPRPLGAIDAVAVAWWLATLSQVALADRQLLAWRADPANTGRTCRVGWWRWSRHPNYFFEWLHWFAYVALGWGAAYGPWTLVMPALLLVLLLFVSGIPWAEAQSLRSRGEDYRRYQRATSAFIPWFPRTEKP